MKYLTLFFQNKSFKKGFTLIELLVVIAIIAILARILIPNLLSARKKAADASLKQTLSGVQSQTSFYALNNPSVGFENICWDTGGLDPQLQAASNAHGSIDWYDTYEWSISAHENDINTTNFNGAPYNLGACHSNPVSGTQWAVSFPLKTSTKYFCVDSTGFSGVVNTFLDMEDGSYTSNVGQVMGYPVYSCK